VGVLHTTIEITKWFADFLKKSTAVVDDNAIILAWNTTWIRMIIGVLYYIVVKI
jgi:hypothetical protein